MFFCYLRKEKRNFCTARQFFILLVLISVNSTCEQYMGARIQRLHGFLCVCNVLSWKLQEEAPFQKWLHRIGRGPLPFMSAP